MNAISQVDFKLQGSIAPTMVRGPMGPIVGMTDITPSLCAVYAQAFCARSRAKRNPKAFWPSRRNVLSGSDYLTGGKGSNLEFQRPLR